jgi:hypothetical protein
MENVHRTEDLMHLQRFQNLLVSGAFLLAATPFLHAASAGIDLFNFAVTSNDGSTTSVADWVSTPADPTALPGMSITPTAGLSFCCNDATGGTTPGLGTINYTFDPGAAGTYQVNFYFDHDLTTAGPTYNEFGVVNNAGSIQAGMSYEIYDADNPSGDIVLGSAGGSTYGNPNNTNEVPGTTSNFLDTCHVAGCNADAGMALGYTFTLSAGQEAVLSATTSLTAPGSGFYLQQVHPVDASNPAATNVFLTGSFDVQAESTGGGTPEPSTWVLLGSALVLLASSGRLRKALKA